MNFVNLYFGLKLLPIIIVAICILIIVVIIGYAMIVEKLRKFKNKITKKFSKR